MVWCGNHHRQGSNPTGHGPHMALAMYVCTDIPYHTLTAHFATHNLFDTSTFSLVAFIISRSTAEYHLPTMNHPLLKLLGIITLSTTVLLLICQFMGHERWEATWLQRHKARRRRPWWYLSGSSRLQQHAPHFSSFISSTSLRKFAATQAPKVLNVHIVPHTHDDVGWRKTVEQYFYGYNESIDARGRVQDIITTSIAALLEQPARTFVWTESKFLHMWWNEMKTRNRTVLHDDLRYLIATQQWSFVNGGWCMHDEASTHYVGMLDQTTLGHDFLLHNLGVVPTVGWQLDPFGHAATQAGLLTAGVGFDALYFGRIDYQDLRLRQDRAACEGLWQTSSVLPPVFWGLTGEYRGNYGPFDGFCFDVLCGDEPLVGANQTRLYDRVVDFVKDLAWQANQTLGNHVQVTMGSDFHYQNAATNFANTDLLISSIMNFQDWNMLKASEHLGPRFDRIEIFYSTPEYYTAQKNKETLRHGDEQSQSQSQQQAIKWEIKHDDFFPYADCPHCYWTGYFTSRTAFKRLERVASSFLQAARQVDSLPPPGNDTTHLCDCSEFAMDCGCQPPLYELEDALGVVQHHDAVSGTAKQHVADDYSKRVHDGLHTASLFMANKLRTLMLNTTEVPDALSNLMFCQLLNETKCRVSEEASKVDDDIYVIVYNPGAMERSTNVRLPVSGRDKIYEITPVSSHHDNSVQVVTPVAVPAFSDKETSSSSSFVLTFGTGKLPPVGAAAFKVSTVKPNSNTTPLPNEPPYSVEAEDDSTISVKTEAFNVFFDRNSGAIQKIVKADIELPIEQQWGYYIPFDSRIDYEADPRENSGAYLFRPSTPDQELKVINPQSRGASFVQTSVGMEVQMKFEEPWIQQTIRVTDQPYVEIEYQVGPLPIDFGRGKEVVTRFLTPIQNNGVFFTDSNGREFQKRKRDYRPTWPLTVTEPIAGNYYPVNTAIFMQDRNVSFSILTDRTRGGSSILDGSLEVMVQRRTVADDHRGVDEPMNETVGGMTPYPPYGKAERVGAGVVVRGIHRLVIGKGSSGAEITRSVMDGIFAEPIVFVGSASPDEVIDFEQPSFSTLGRAIPLPPNVMLTTLKKLRGRGNTTLLLRLGHQYDIGESRVLSRPVKVNLSLLLAGHYDVLNITEKTLSGNQNLSDWIERRYNWTEMVETYNNVHDISSTTITLHPMEIRTFEVQVKEKDGLSRGDFAAEQ